VRTELDLGKDQSAAVVRLPVTLTASRPVNVNVRRYDGEVIHVALNGRGRVGLRIATGEFAVEPGAAYRIEAEGVERIAVGDDATLTVPLTLNGPLSLTIGRAAN